MRQILLAITLLALGCGPSPQRPAPEPSPSAAAPRRVVGYYHASAIRRGFPIDSIDGRLTHINYAFGNITPDGIAILGNPCLDVGQCPPGQADPHAEPGGHFARLRRLRERYPHIRTLISIGGWGWSANFSDAAATPDARARFITSTLDVFIRAHPGVFDGVDLDWEYPVRGGLPQNRTRPEDGVNYTLLAAAFRDSLDVEGRRDGTHYLLTIAAPAGPRHLENFEVQRLAAILDFITVMTYDYHTAGRLAHFNAPLGNTEGDPTPGLNVRATIDAYLAAGLPREKLVVGVPFFGYGYGGVPPIGHGRFQPAERNGFEGAAAGPIPPWVGAIRFRRIAEAMSEGFQRHWDAGAGVPWLYHPDKRVWITYDDAESIGLKADLVRDRALGGVMIWELSGDDGTLLDNIYTRIQGAGPAGPASPIRFEPVQPELLSQGGSLVNAWADYDGDGDLDLFVGFGGSPNRLYRNDRGVLVETAAAAGIADSRPTRSAAWGDFDADGDPDLLVGFAPGPESVLRLYRNDRGRFADVTTERGVARDSGAVRQAAWVDVDGDGDLDLFVAFRDRANALFRNDGARFGDVAAEVGLADMRRSVGAMWLDYDEDGDLDLYVGNMDGDANGLFRNDGGRFTDVAAGAGLAWGGRLPRDATNGTVRPCAADVDGDGRLDVFTANYGKNGLFLNRGGGRFEDASSTWGIDIDSRYDACAFADADHDGRLDLYVNGTVTGGVSYRDYLFRNLGDRFEDVTPDNVRVLQADHGVQWADFDGDGDTDLSLTGARPDGMHLVLGNALAAADARRSLRIQAVDQNGRATRAGAEVRLFVAGTRRPLGTRIVDSGSGYNAQSEMPVHFGLATLDAVDVEVTWPSRGTRATTRMSGVDPREWRGRVLVVRVGSASDP